MKKGFSKFLVVLLAGLLLGSSTFAMQQLLPVHAGEKFVRADLIKPVDKPEQQEQLDDILPILKAEYKVTATEEAEPAEKENLAEKVVAVKQENKSATASLNNQTSVSTTKTEKSLTNTSTQQVTIEKPAGSSVVAAPEKEAVEVKAEEKKTPANPYKISSARTFELVTRVVAKNTGDGVSTNVRIEVPLITTSSLYYSRVSESFSIEPSEVKTVGGTRVGVFMLGDLEPGTEIVVETKTQVRTSIIEFLADFIPKDSNKTSSYLSESSGIESTNGQIINLSNEITQSLSSDWEQARAITRWVATNIRYDASAVNRNSGALQALQTRTGVCEDYAALCAALARAANIPARIVYGYTDNGTNWPASGTFTLRGYRHAWVEYNLEGRGWVPAEPTRSNSSKLYFGTLPHNRYIVQNYNNMSLKGNFTGGKLSLSWSDSLQ